MGEAAKIIEFDHSTGENTCRYINAQKAEKIQKKNKRKSNIGIKTVSAFKDPADAKKISDWLEKNKRPLHKLLFDLELALGRRCGDILDSRWSAFFYPNGKYREFWIPPVRTASETGHEIAGEQKTGKYIEIPIGEYIKYSIEKYCEITGCDPSENDYSNSIAIQYTGNYKGKELTYSGFLKPLKQASKECGMSYNVGTHSMRKTFGKNIIETSPDDPLAKSVVQDLFGHSSEKVTGRYIGIDREKRNGAVGRVDEKLCSTMIEGKEYRTPEQKYVISLKTSDLRQIIQLAYNEGLNAQNGENLNEHLDRGNLIADSNKDGVVTVKELGENINSNIDIVSEHHKAPKQTPGYCSAGNQNTAIYANRATIKAGTVKITAKANGVKAVCKITVKKPSVKLNKKKITLYTSGTKTAQLKATVNGPSKKVTWKSSNKKQLL